MGSFVSLHSLRVSIREAHPEMTPQQVTAEAERYYTSVVKPVLSEREIIAFFENGEYRHEGIPRVSCPVIPMQSASAAERFRDGFVKERCLQANILMTSPTAMYIGWTKADLTRVRAVLPT